MVNGGIDFPGLQLNEIIQALPPDVIASIGRLVVILQTLGVVFIIYFIFLIVNAVMNFKRGVRIKKIEKKVEEIDDKLDKILDKKHKAEHKTKKSRKAKK